jgi:phosphoglycerate dehydrogenase-like enzyme
MTAGADGRGDDALRVLWLAALPEGGAPEVPGAVVRIALDVEAASAHADWAEVLVDGRVTPLLDGASLRHVVVPWAGLGAELRDALLARPHLRASNSHSNAPFVAEHMVAMTMALAHRLREADEALRRGDWGDRARPLRSTHLGGRHALLLGYGHIARAALPLLRGIGLSLTALRRRPRASAAAAGVRAASEGATGAGTTGVGTGGAGTTGAGGAATDAEPDGATGAVREIGRESLLAVLPSVDVVLCSLPGTPETTGLMDAQALAALPTGALVVNVGRGSVFDEEALYQALVEGHVGGAALDVWYRYPEGDGAERDTLPANRPFWQLPQVLLSPHRADSSDESRQAQLADVCATIAALARGEERSPVDVAAGY